MRHITRFLLGMALVAVFGSQASAGPIDFSPLWYEFAFGAAGSFATGGAGTVPSPSGNSVFADDPPWTFTAPDEGALFTVTDAFLRGDTFSVFDFGVLIGSTPVPPGGGGATTEDPAVAVLDPTYSHATFALGAGAHSITIRVDNSPSLSGAAYFLLSPVPEPAAIISLGLGGVALVGVARFRRRRDG